ncbi:hypothetical protein RDABS01_015442 [Bienertia sinuspersici]
MWDKSTGWKWESFVEYLPISVLKMIQACDLDDDDSCDDVLFWNASQNDGAAKGTSGQAGGGGIFRNHMGKFAGCYSLNLGICTAIHAELKALWYGLKLAWDMGLKKIDVRMDNSACVQILNHNNNYD